MTYTTEQLLKRYTEWDTARAENYEREEDAPVSSSTWENSDDEGVELAHLLADALRAPSPEAQRVLDLCASEAQINAEAGDVHTEADIAADIAQRLYTVHRVIAHDDGEPGPLANGQREIWTCTVKTPYSPTPIATVHATEDAAIDSLRLNYDDEGEYQGKDIVDELEGQGYFINIDSHLI